VPDWSLVLTGAAAAVVGLVAVALGRARLGYALVVASTAVGLVVSDAAELGIVIAVLTGLSLELPRPSAARKAVMVPHRTIALYASVAALLLAAADLPNDPSTALRVAAVVMMAAAGVVAWRASGVVGADVVLVMVAVGAAAVYGAVPDTEQITVVAVALLTAAGAVVVSGFAGRIGAQAWCGRATVAVAAALVTWAAAAGAGGRPAAFVSVGGALAVLVVVSLTPAAAGVRWWSPAGVVLVGVHAAVAVGVARTGGVAEDVAPAVVMAAVGCVVGGAALSTAFRKLAASDD